MRANWVIAWEKSGKLRPRPSCSKGGYTSTIRCITQLISRALICWIEIYPMDIPIHPMNNWGLNGTRTLASAMPMRGFTSWSIKQTSICLIIILVAQFYHVITQLHMASPPVEKKGNRNTVLGLFYTVVISKTLCMNHISFFQWRWIKWNWKGIYEIKFKIFQIIADFALTILKNWNIKSAKYKVGL